MFGLIILLLTAISAGIAALRILGHPGGLWEILASVSVLNALASLVVVLRKTWGRRVVFGLLGTQIVGAFVGLVVVAVVEVRDIPLDMAISLLTFIFVPVVAAIVAISLVAAWSINRLEWRDR